MTREPDSRVAELFDQALELPAERRAAFLAEACAGDEALRLEVLDLLRHHVEDSFLEPAGADAFAREAAPLPERIGPFRPVGVLGFGGMGVVYEAQQDHPDRRVALKVLRVTHASPTAIRRFLQEGQALARLRHPGIVPIFDAGTATLPEGQVPYFAMELVEGRRLDRFAQEETSLTTTGRLELFLRICEAVQHAHDRGVIHRDLKPANILVEASGQPRILDFGVARLIDAEVPTTLRTAAGLLLGTIAYMSPEQAAGPPEPIDQRCDVYALGVLLYELLSGSQPFHVTDKPLLEALRAIREDEPSPLRAAARDLPVDLDVIVHKCIEKEPGRRYATVDELAADVRRHLRGEPISAQAPGAITQFRMFVRRNRRVLGSAALLIVALSIGLGATLYQRNEARRERDQAQKMLDALEFMLALPDPELGMRYDVTVRELLDSSASSMLAGLKDDPELKARLGHLLGRTYHGLGEFARASELLAPALAYYSATLGPGDPRTLSTWRFASGANVGLGKLSEGESGFRSILEAQLQAPIRDAERIAETRSLLADAWLRLGRLEEAEELMRVAYEDARRELGPDHEWTLRVQAGHAVAVRDPARQRELLIQAIADHERVYGPDHVRTLPALQILAMDEMARGDFAAARVPLERVSSWQVKQMGLDHPDTLTTQMWLANCLWWLDDYAGAETIVRPLLKSARRVLGPDHPTTLNALSLLASCLKDQRKLAEALPLCEEAALENARVLGPMNVEALNAEQFLGEACFLARDFARAESILRAVADARAATLGEADVSTLNSRRTLVLLLIEQGRAQEAEFIARGMRDVCERENGVLDAYTTRSGFLIASALMCAGRFEDSERVAREQVVAVERLQGADCEDSVAVRREHAEHCARIEQKLRAEWERAVEAGGAASDASLTLSFRRGRVLVRARRFPEAEELALQSRQLARENLPAGHPVAALLQGLLGFCHLEAGDLARAEPELLLAYDEMCAALGPDSGTSCQTAGLIAQLYDRVGRPAEAARYRGLAGAR